ncbi:carbohydrate ABC transporter permease [Streptomyces phaeochromogenes]|uniref:Multiple sugar transport system permease protein n=2 Tax=Streptomyces phaeochromogenes group TaxID=2838332 RepID=A0ABU0SLX7_9ACTN|nr:MULTISPECIES: carbohydrate ABC transporter permease [Streptomyces]MCX5600230.1 carbohydrate ABC transporter permease [Streptomyces phaeochromogenes]MCZ4515460.1 carbohydrate ABC transporter permease [Streptomyces sp. ActVer]MDQ1024518.1 multiple sugar transport system permease protein [Streptomyces umbrinus]WRZ27951.1 carbohydrate ABC transporter permease [Streptomyces phaeochromogenes]WSD13512.1 carbohydrate ABC transporter permease [Streptomyces phaeochromogenes]
MSAITSAHAPKSPLQKLRSATGSRRIFIHTVLIGVAIVMLYPLLWMLSSSFKPDTQIFTQPGLIPSSVRPENYSEGWSGSGNSFSLYITNSLIVTIGAVIGNVISCSLAAYAFARFEFRGKKIWFGLMLGTLMLPTQAVLIPQYTIFYNLTWINTYLPLIVPKFLAVDAFFIFLMVQFIRSIPRELDHAAMMDGANPFQIYWKIILPLMKPALITTTIFTFIWTYDDFLHQLVYLQQNDKFTVPLGLTLFMDQTSGSSYGAMFAMSTLALLPTLICFLIFQKRLVEGLATSGMKG